MKAVQSTGYAIYFNANAYKELNEYLLKYTVSSIFVLVDENTFTHCYPEFKKKFISDMTPQIIKVKAGEIHKNITTCVEVWKQLTALGADRKSLLVNLGGGMVTDLGGFVASTFKRGIKFINVPTTILSMVDASVGSKTGVDLDQLKNLIGLFANPEMVLIDSDYLTTLSAREKRSGMAEILKYGLTFDSDLLNEVKSDKWKSISNLDKMIFKSIEIKNRVVLKDFKEEHLRKVLNFGHTVGHAIESYFLDHESLPRFTHGEAIAIGMVVEAYLSHKIYKFPLSELDSLKGYIHKTYGKNNISEEHFEPIIVMMKHDKKNSNGVINYVLLKDLTEFVIDAQAPAKMVMEGINYYNS